MFFVLSKTLNYLMMPLTIICGLFIASLLWKKPMWKRRLFLAGFILLIVLSNPFLANEVMSQWEVKTTPFAEMKPHKLAIVLTGTTIGDIEPNDRVYFAKGADRVTHTVQLYKLGLIQKILVSGGSGRLLTKEEPEANKFKRAMVMMGVPADSILLENQTRNTAESAIEVKKLLSQLKYKPQDCLLITSAFHMRRSLAVYRHNGLAIEHFTTDFYTFPRNFNFDTLFIPRIDSLMIWQKLFKEWVGMIAYSVAGYA